MSNNWPCRCLLALPIVLAQRAGRGQYRGSGAQPSADRGRRFRGHVPCAQVQARTGARRGGAPFFPVDGRMDPKGYALIQRMCKVRDQALVPASCAPVCASALRPKP